MSNQANHTIDELAKIIPAGIIELVKNPVDGLMTNHEQKYVMASYPCCMVGHAYCGTMGYIHQCVTCRAISDAILFKLEYVRHQTDEDLSKFETLEAWVNYKVQWLIDTSVITDIEIYRAMLLLQPLEIANYFANHMFDKHSDILKQKGVIA